MISRLILVGVVGALGVSLPGGAEWGSGLTWAQTETNAHVSRHDAVAFEPIVVDGGTVKGIAGDLSGRSESLQIPTTPMMSVASRPQDEFAPVPSGDSVELKLMAEVCRFADEAESRATSVEWLVDDLFAENEVWGEPAAEEIVSSTSPTRESRPSFEPIAVTEDASSVADELNRFAEGIDIDPAKPAISTPRRPSFEPIAVTDASSSLADELNRESEGQSIAPDTDRRLGTAFRLTLDAALAWMNVLTKTMPAPITAR